MSLSIRYGLPSEGAALIELQRRAGLQWESDRAALLAHPDAIQLPASQLDEQRVRVAEIDGRIAGFSVLLPKSRHVSELDGLFVEPELWRRGIGGALMLDAMQLVRDRGATVMEVTANVNAEGFYEKFGFVPVFMCAEPNASDQSSYVQTSFGPARRMRCVIPSRSRIGEGTGEAR